MVASSSTVVGLALGVVLVASLAAGQASGVPSAGGARIVFESDRDSPPGGNRLDENGIELYIMDADGTNVGRLTSNRSHDADPSCSPDGRRVAFSSRRAGNTDIYVMNMDGGRAQRITTSQSRETQPSWSPDGKALVYIRHSGHGSGDIYVRVVGSAKSRLLVGGKADDFSPRWSPLGDRVAFVRTNEAGTYTADVFAVALDGGRPTKLVANAYSDSISWSPDGSMLVVSRPSRVDVSETRTWTVDAKTDRYERKLPGVDSGSPAWSPDGTTIAVSTEPGGIGTIVVNGRRVRELLSPNDLGGWNWGPSWCP